MNEIFVRVIRLYLIYILCFIIMMLLLYDDFNDVVLLLVITKTLWCFFYLFAGCMIYKYLIFSSLISLIQKYIRL